MNKFLPSFFLVLLLVVCSGCTSTAPPAEAPVNETPTLPVLHHGEVAVDLSAIEINDPELFTANLTSTISTVLPDSRAGLLLDHGWNIASARQEFNDEVLDRPYVRVEFMKNNLSFYFLVDEENDQILRGYCGAAEWIASVDPRPSDYYQALDKQNGLQNVVDVRDKSDLATVMIYGDSKIYYLNPDF